MAMGFDLKEIKMLKGEFALPLYVFDEQGFVDNYRRLENEMKKEYPKYRISYSYKTNYTPYICRTVKDLGGYAEVVSGMEYWIAKKIGYEDSRIIFNGPEKGNDGIEAFLNGAIVNADNLDEIKAYCDVAEKFPEKKFKVGLRVNLDIGQDFVSRFGMDENDIKIAFHLVENVPNLNITGLHCHISRCRGKEAWRRRAEIMLDLSDTYFERCPEYIDLGSGMFGSMDPKLASQFGSVPSYEEYAEVTAGLFARHFEGNGPAMFTEPGTTLVNRYFSLLAEVTSIKSIRGKEFAVISCSEHNLGETCRLKRLPIDVISAGNMRRKHDCLDMVGYTCLEQDVLYQDYCGELGVGDFVAFGNVGGYSNVYKPPFIRPNCAMVAKRKNGTYELLKSAENYEDILHTYHF